MPKHSNEYYLKGLKNQNSGVIQQIFKEFLPPITALVKGNNGTGEDAKDVFMYGIEVIYKKVKDDELELTASFLTYLYQICKNKWLKQLRKKKPDARVTIEEPMVSNRMTTEQDNLFTELSERQQLFREMFLLLHKDCQKVLNLSWHSDKSSQAISEELGWTYAYLRKRKHNCKEQLIQLVKEDPRYPELTP